MPLYCYVCDACGRTLDRFCACADRDLIRACHAERADGSRCRGRLVRDFAATVRTTRDRGAELPEWRSRAAGVHPKQVPAADRALGHLGVRHDPATGDAIVPGHRRREFLREKGYTELAGAPTTRHPETAAPVFRMRGGRTEPLTPDRSTR